MAWAGRVVPVSGWSGCVDVVQGDRVSGRAEDVDLVGAHVCGEQDVESVQCDGVEDDQGRWSAVRWLGMQEAAPPGVCSGWRRPVVGGSRDQVGLAGVV